MASAVGSAAVKAFVNITARDGVYPGKATAGAAAAAESQTTSGQHGSSWPHRESG